MKTFKLSYCLFLLLLCGTKAHSLNCVTNLNQTGGSATTDEAAHSMVKDIDGNLIVTGIVNNNGNGDIIISKVSPSCGILWTTTWDGPDRKNDSPWDITVDKDKFIYITGMTEDANQIPNVVTLKIDANGVIVWDAIYDGSHHLLDWGKAIAVLNGNVYVTGYTKDSPTAPGHQGLTLCYFGNGVLAFVGFFSGADDCKNYSICTDYFGYVYVTGEAKNGNHPVSSEIYTLQYDNSLQGNLNWANFYHLPFTPANEGFNRPNKISTDDKFLYVGGTGYNYGTTSDDFIILKYEFGGALLFDVSYDWNHEHDALNDLYVDKIYNYIYATGGTAISNQGLNERDVMTIQVDPSDLSKNWDSQTNGAGDQWDYGMEIDLDCNRKPYVGAKSQQIGSVNYEYLLLKYDINNGAVVWDETYNDAGTHSHLNDIVVLREGVYASGHAGSSVQIQIPHFSKKIVCNEIRLRGDEIKSEFVIAYPNPTNGIFNYEADQSGMITILDLQNRTIARLNFKEGKNEYNLGDLANGIYYFIFRNQNNSDIHSEKIVVQK